jgi:hypothetical protein
MKHEQEGMEGLELPMQVSTLPALDALVGRHVMGSTPKIVWEDTYTNFRFDNLPEALDAMRDPCFSAFVPDELRPNGSLKEVHEYPAYTADLACALKVVEYLSGEDKPLTLIWDVNKWRASFAGEFGAAEAEAAPVAICLAALRCRGIDVRYETEESADLAACLV